MLHYAVFHGSPSDHHHMHASPAAFLKHPQTAFLAESDLTVVLLPEYVEQVRQLYGVTHAISIPNAIEEQPPSLYESIKKGKNHHLCCQNFKI